MVWYGLTAGVVVGPDSPKAKDDSRAGGAVSGGKDSRDDGHAGAHGLFSAFGHQVWFYVGGILGFGENFGPYFTTGPMLGHDCDWAVGAGVHLGRKVGVGVVVPVFQAMRHSDKLSAIVDQTGYALAQAGQTVSQFGYDALEKIVSDPLTGMMALTTGLMIVKNRSDNNRQF